MTATRRCTTSTARSRPVRWSRSSVRTERASRRCSRASSACSSRWRAASSAAISTRKTSPTCRRPPRSTAPFRSTSTTWWRWGCGGAPVPSAVSTAPRGPRSRRRSTLSGGQMQRMLFARLLLQDASVIVLDEPFNAVDAKTSADLFDLVRRWHGERRTVLTAMHDLDFVRANFPETLLLAREPVAWGRTASVLTPENLLTARRMCEAFDQDAALCADEQTPSLPPRGEVVRAVNPVREHGVPTRD